MAEHKDTKEIVYFEESSFFLAKKSEFVNTDLLNGFKMTKKLHNPKDFEVVFR